MFTCKFCKRCYQRKIYYSRHIGVCELICKSVKERALDSEEGDDTPTVRALYDVVLELVNKVAKMEKTIIKLTKCADIKMKKINMEDSLNESKGDESKGKPFEDFIETIKVERKHLEYLFKNDLISGILFVIQDFNPLDTIKAFEQKRNDLYVYSTSKWQIMPDNMFQQLVNIVNRMLMNEFVNWQTENSDKMEQDVFAIKYATNVKKILGNNLTREQIYSRVKVGFYKTLLGKV